MMMENQDYLQQLVGASQRKNSSVLFDDERQQGMIESYRKSEPSDLKFLQALEADRQGLQTPTVDPVMDFITGFGTTSMAMKTIKSVRPLLTGLLSSVLGVPAGQVTQVITEKFPSTTLPVNIAMGVVQSKVLNKMLDVPKVATNLLSSQKGGAKILPERSLTQWWKTGAEKDIEWRKLSPKDKWYYEIGQKTLPSNVFQKYEHLNPVERGKELVKDLGPIRSIWLQGAGYKLGAGATLSTGPTPLTRYLAPRVGAAGAISAAGIIAHEALKDD